jgi:hypothetical protein
LNAAAAPRALRLSFLVSTHRRSIEFLLLVCAVHPLAALAETKFTPVLQVEAPPETKFTVFGAAEYTYNSNVFYAQSGYPVSGLDPAQGYGDSYATYSAGADLIYQIAHQRLHVGLTGSDFRYQKFTQLDRQEYKIDAGWTGTFWSAWNGNFDVIRDQMMEPFLQQAPTTTLNITTEQREEAGLGVQFLPAWRAEASGYTSDTHWPLPGEPNVRLRESEGDLVLKYLGTAAVTSGVKVAYLAGTYSGNTDEELNSSYRQWGAGILANYVSGHSTLTADVSYTDRTSSGQQSALNTISGVTAELNYFNQLTGKTSLTTKLSRAFNPYYTNQGSSIDNIASATFSWQATFRIKVDATYAYDYIQYPGQGNNPIGSDRLDHLQTASLEVDYHPWPWLSLKPYAGYETRTSNFLGGNFDASTYGVKLTLTLP